MDKTLPRLKDEMIAPAAQRLSTIVGDVVIDQILSALRQGTLLQTLRLRPRATRWCVRRYLAPLFWAGGDALADEVVPHEATRFLLQWGMAQLRPDGAPFDAHIERPAWLDSTSWRPFLAVACHFNLLPVTSARDRYRERPDESAAERLCGLWDVAPSSFYRHLEKGRRQLADILLDQPMPSERLLALCRAAQSRAYRQFDLSDAERRQAWHARQADASVQRGDARAALWHRLQAADVEGLTGILQRFCHQLAQDPMTDRFLQLLPQPLLEGRPFVRLLLARAGLARIRGAGDQELRACEQALRVAAADDDRLMIGVAYGALGKFHEPRDRDRAFSFFQESAVFLEKAAEASVDGDARDIRVAYLGTLVQLAWLYILRNDPRARPVLDRAEELRAALPLPDDSAAMLEQAWSEYWRRAGDYQRALEAALRALQIYERTGNQQKVLRSYGNLALLYGHLHDVERAIEYSRRVLALAERSEVDPETVSSTRVNLGLSLVWQKKFDEGIEQYQLALEQARAARLRVVVGRTHYNLAEAYYLRFQAYGRADDEQLGDHHTDAALAAWPLDSGPEAADATRRLKREVLGQHQAGVYDRLLPGETAAHFDAMNEVRRQRERLAVPQTAATQIDAHLAIASAYVDVAVKERETAVALIEAHGLGERFGERLQRLRDAFEQGLARELRVSADWARHAPDVIGDERSRLVLRRLLDHGSINKSGYAQLCGISLGTASKHLSELARLGTLRQEGRGPTTRYTLPA